MGTAERRNEIMRVLCRKKHETVLNLAKEFGVSERTILRDVVALSLTEHIYTQCGRYGEGVYVDERYKPDRMYMRSDELEVLNKLLINSMNKSVFELSNVEIDILQNIITQYRCNFKLQF